MTKRGVQALGVALALAVTALPAWGDPGPRVDHQPVTSATAHQPFIISAHIVSQTRFPVVEPTVYLRTDPAGRFARVAMQPLANQPDTWAATLPADSVVADFDYYLEAFDKDDNGPSRVGSDSAPLHVQVVQPAPAPPPIDNTKVAPTPPPPTPPPEVREQQTASNSGVVLGLRVAGGVGLGLGVVGLGVGLANALSERNTVSQMTTPATIAQYHATAESQVTQSQIWTGVGLGALGVGGALLIASFVVHSDPPAVTLSPAGGPGLAFAF